MADEVVAPVAFTEAQIEEIQKVTANVVNNAIGARDKRLEKQFAGLLDGVTSSLTKKLEEFGTRVPVADPDPNDPGGKGGKNKDRSNDVVIATMQKQLADAQTKIESAERSRAQERGRRRMGDLRRTLSEELIANGTDPARAPIAVGLLIDSSRRVKFEAEDDDEAPPIFRLDDTQSVDLKTGIKTWIKTDEGKFFLPPSGANGSGSRPSRGTGAPTEKLTLEQQQERVMTALGDALQRER